MLLENGEYWRIQGKFSNWRITGFLVKFTGFYWRINYWRIRLLGYSEYTFLINELDESDRLHDVNR